MGYTYLYTFTQSCQNFISWITIKYGNLIMRIYDIETPSAGTHFFEEETMAAC